MMGDHYTDMDAGGRAGMKRCLALYGYGDCRGFEYELGVNSFDEFVAAVLRA